MENKIKIFENKQVRTLWNADEEEWYFSVVDIVSVLTDNDYQTARNYWKILRKRLSDEGSELVTNCNRLKMRAFAGEKRKRFEKETGTKVTTALNAENKPALEQKKK